MTITYSLEVTGIKTTIQIDQKINPDEEAPLPWALVSNTQISNI